MMEETRYKITAGGLACIGNKEEVLALLEDDLENFRTVISIERINNVDQ